MCVGESTTYGNGTVSAYRGHLFRMYQNAGIKANFIGPITEKNDDMPLGSGHAGTGGFYITEVSQRINPWIESYNPQVIYLTIGGNDTSQGKADKFPNDTRETAPGRLESLIYQILKQKPDVELYVSTITPSDNYYNTYRVNYNEAITPIIKKISSEHPNVHFVDTYKAITDYSADLQSDGLHPTESGYAKVAKIWFEATKDKIASMAPTNPPKLICTPRTGEYMAKLDSAGAVTYSALNCNAISVEPNTDYIATFHIKGDTGTTALLKINTTVNGSWKQIAAATANPGPNWSTNTIKFNTGNYTSVFLAVQDSSKIAGTIYFDDFAITKADDETHINLITKNPSFENLKEGWSLGGIYSIVKTAEIIPTPEQIDKELAIKKTLTMTFEELASDGRPGDIDCSSYNGNSAYYTNPYEATQDRVTSKAGIFYTDNDGHRYISMNPVNSYQTVKFIYTRGGYQDITGFDEMRLKMKFVTRTDGTIDYSSRKPSDYKMKLSLSDILNSSSVTGSSAEVFINPSEFNKLETITVKRSEFAGGKLDMDGRLSKYTDAAGQHQIQMVCLPKGGVGTMIDEIEFVWYENDATLEVKNIAFENDGININAIGLTEGTTHIKVKIHNAKSEECTDSKAIASLYNIKENTLESVNILNFTAAADETIESELSVTIPDGKAPTDYQLKFLLWDSECSPITKPYIFDCNGISLQNISVNLIR